MTRERKDRSGNWFIEHCGGALLQLTPLRNIVRWRAAHNVLSHPKQIPDGLLEVTFAGKTEPDPFLIEIETYPDPSVYAQIRDDLAMVLLDRGVLPDLLLLVLCPRGNLRVEPDHVIVSAHGWSELRVKTHVIHLWELPARDLLSMGDVRLVPWVPLCRFDGPPRPLFEECRERIEQEAAPDEKDNLLAITRTMAETRYNDPRLLSILGVHAMSLAKVFFELPVGKRYLAEKERKTTIKLMIRLLEDRFGEVPKALAKQILAIKDQEALESLVVLAAKSPDLKSFRARLDQD